jgi:hypothetical protein
MKRHSGIVILSSLAISALALLPVGAHADVIRPLPAALYPAHTTLSTSNNVSNTQMDCDWGFTCANGAPLMQQPLFHFTTEDDLHRISGWAQFGRMRTQGKQMRFAIYASQYVDGQDAEGLPWSLRAFVDFRLTTLAHGFAELNRDPVLNPHGVLGNSGGQILRGRSQDVLALSCWAGSVEVEAVAIYAHGDHGARSIALRDLTRQARVAVREAHNLSEGGSSMTDSR